MSSAAAKQRTAPLSSLIIDPASNVRIFPKEVTEAVNAATLSTAVAPLGASRFRMLLRRANADERRSYFPSPLEARDM